jgi:hypothetical protein
MIRMSMERQQSMPAVRGEGVYAGGSRDMQFVKRPWKKDCRDDAEMSDRADACRQNQQVQQRKGESQESVWLHWQMRPTARKQRGEEGAVLSDDDSARAPGIKGEPGRAAGSGACRRAAQLPPARRSRTQTHCGPAYRPRIQLLAHRAWHLHCYHSVSASLLLPVPTATVR